VKDHVDLVGIAFILYGALQLLGAALLGVLAVLALGGAMMAAGGSAAPDLVFVGGFYGVFGILAVVTVGLLAVPYVIVGAGLRRRRRWAWFGGIACALLSLSSIPIGTAIGLWAMVTLLDREVNQEFNGSGAPA
jgi:hypothetical protein